MFIDPPRVPIDINQAHAIPNGTWGYRLDRLPSPRFGLHGTTESSQKGQYSKQPTKRAKKVTSVHFLPFNISTGAMRS
jgi:hypothetical protein